MFYFDKCDISINDQGFIAENVTLDIENSIVQLLTLGRRGAGSAIAGAPMRIQLSMEYPMKTKGDPNLELISNLKLGSLPTSLIYFAGFVGNFYLNDFSFSAQANRLLKARVTYSAFSELAGYFQESIGAIDYPTNLDDIAHGWTTSLNLGDDRTVIKAYDFDYSFTTSLAPQFILGSRNPAQVILLGATEKVTLTTDDFYPISPYGEKAKVRLANAVSNNSIALLGISLLEQSHDPDLVINLKESILTSSSISASPDGPVKLRTVITREF